MKKIFIVGILAFNIVLFAVNNNYLMWLDNYKNQLENFYYAPTMENKQKLDFLLEGKPLKYSGNFYNEWFDIFSKYIEIYFYSQTENNNLVLSYAMRAVSERNIPGFYSKWLKFVEKYIENYFYAPTDKNYDLLVRLRRVIPFSTIKDFELWNNVYEKYLDYSNDDAVKIILNYLLTIKPEESESGDTLTLDFLKNIDKTAKDIIKTSKNRKKFRNLISLYKEILINYALDGKDWAREEYQYLKQLFGAE